MAPSVYGLILLIMIILIGSACCSGVEAAFLAVNSIRILEIASKQKPKSSANQLLKLRKHLGRGYSQSAWCFTRLAPGIMAAFPFNLFKKISLLSSKTLWSGTNINCELACLKKKWKNELKQI